MEKRVENKVSSYINHFKDDIKQKMNDLDLTNDRNVELLQYIYDYNALDWKKEDFTRRKRVKNQIPLCDRCLARRANGEQCTRRRKDESSYCGTHSKGIPHGEYCQQVSSEEQKKIVELTVIDIGGINYYVDDSDNVYNVAHVLSNKVNPDRIGTLDRTCSDGKLRVKTSY